MTNTVIILILFAVVLGTSAITFLFQSKVSKIKQYVNTFTSSIVAALIFHHILPETYAEGGSIVGIFILIGLMFQLILERVTGGIEHGHIHSERNAKSKRTVIIGLMLGLCIHSFIEGLALLPASNTELISEVDSDEESTSSVIIEEDHSGHDHSEHDHSTQSSENNIIEEIEVDHSGHNHLELKKNPKGGVSAIIKAIVYHKVPVTIVLSLFLISLGISLLNFSLLILIFASSTPLGALLGEKLSTLQWFDNIAIIFVSISTGMLLHIVTAILFEHSHSKKSAFLHIGLIACGIGIGVLLF
jgi:zinc transporter ZupT